jgi:hypothetical protein
MHQSAQLHRRVPYGALVRLERSAAKVARCVLRGERSREAPDLPGGRNNISYRSQPRPCGSPRTFSRHFFSVRPSRI